MGPPAVAGTLAKEEERMALKQCWEIKGCGRQTSGPKVAELGECVASKEKLGHSCWAIAGTLCGGEVQGSAAQKEGNCMRCEVYGMYHRTVGTEKAAVIAQFPDEHRKLQDLVISRFKK